MRILVRTPNWIGDQILAYPFFQQLRARYPSAWISVVCTEWVKDIQFRGFVDEVLILPRSREATRWKSALDLLRFSKTLRERGPWDLGITLPNSFGAALLLKGAGAKRLRGYRADGRSFLLNEALDLDPRRTLHRAQAYLDLLRPEGLAPFDAVDYWSAGVETDFDPYRHWPETEPIEPPFEPFFVVAPGSNAESRRWDSARFARFISEMTTHYRLKAVVVGGRAEKEIANRLLREGIAFEDYTARGWVAAHWKIFRAAAFTLCNDSGLAHVASLCGSKVQIVWGAGDPRRTRPMGPGPVQVRSNPVECWPCERNQCRLTESAQNQCLIGIEPEKVIEEVVGGFLAV